MSTLIRWALFPFILLVAMVASGVLIGLFAVGWAYPKLPPVDSLADYNPKVPLRVYSADNHLIGEFGEERRAVVKFEEVPLVMRQAILAAEDDRFYSHSGVDYMGVLRAAITNVTSGGRSQGASTITMQVARNFFISSEKTYTRKFYEALLAFKIEATLTKDKIFEVYMNQIYLGQRAYGFASAAQIYFGKKLKDITPAEAAMLAGLPKAPSAYNPVVNPKRAAVRQQYILDRMHALGYLETEQYQTAKKEPLKVKNEINDFTAKGDYVSETVRQLVFDRYGEETYTRGLRVYTTVIKEHQDAAYAAVRRGILEYERRHAFRGPEAFADLKDLKEETLEEALTEHQDSDELLAAVVTEIAPKAVKVYKRGGGYITLTGEGLRFISRGLDAKAQPNIKLKPGAILRIYKGPPKAGKPDEWLTAQLPEVEAAFVAADPRDGAIKAMVGGFDFNANKFNRVTQAWRQPGSSFKPFIYSGSLEKGLTASTVINDAPIFIDPAQTGGQLWEPKNYDGKYDGPMRMRQALTRSKNLVSVRIIQQITPKFAQDYATRFGFDAEKHPPFLTMALGAGSVTPYQMVGGYSVFANGGYRVNPYLIQKITDDSGRVLFEAKPIKANDEANRVIDARNAFIMRSLMGDVVKFGTATRAMALKRNDLAGKTGTTNDHYDAWFAGFNSSLVGIAWIGFDQPKKLGGQETGGAAALPIWIDYMRVALKGVPDSLPGVPEGVVNIGGEFYYREFQPGDGVTGLGLGDGTPESQEKVEEIKNQIF